MIIPEVTVIATIYNSEQIIEELVNRIAISCSEISTNFEIILVEDCGKDKSWKKTQSICKQYPFVKAIKLTRNFGQQIAMSAGMRYAKGGCVVIMDGDLQNPPEAIPEIYRELNKGFDIVYTVSNTRNNWKDEWSSIIFWFLINNLLKVGMIPNQLMMKGMTQNFLAKYNLYDEQIRIVSGITHDVGLNSTVLKIQNKKRTIGKGNYTFFKRFHLMIDIVLAITTKPLAYLINVSIFALFLSFLVGTWTLINFFMYDVPPGYTTLLTVISFFGSLTLLVLGIIGRYLSNIYQEVKNRPLFLVEQEINFQN